MKLGRVVEPIRTVLPGTLQDHSTIIMRNIGSSAT
jgi:hypothetical protein